MSGGRKREGKTERQEAGESSTRPLADSVNSQLQTPKSGLLILPYCRLVTKRLQTAL